MGADSIPHVLPRISDPDLELTKYVNFLIALLERRENAAVVGARPFEITIDPTTICQLSCPYCVTGAGTIQRARGVLGEAMHRRMVDEMAESLFVVWYFSTGEPLLNKRLPELVAATKGKEIFSVISTNLSLPLKDEQIDALLTCGLGCISASVDGASPETYVRYRVGGNFDLVMTNLRRLVRRKRELGLEYPLIEWRFLVFRHNQHEIPAVREMAARYEVDLLEFHPGHAPPDATPDQVQPWEPIDLQPSISGVGLDRAARRAPTTMLRNLGAGRERIAPPPVERGRRLKCDWLYFGSALFPNGSVGPCCLSNDEPDDFGMLSDSASFPDIWNNERYREARALWANGGWENTKLVCARCPDPNAQDYQFRTTVQGVLRNAPDWALKVMAAAPERFFFDVDYALSPLELAPLRNGLRIEGDFSGVDRCLAERSRRAGESGDPRIEWLRSRLTA